MKTKMAENFLNSVTEIRKTIGVMRSEKYLLEEMIETGHSTVTKVEGAHDIGFKFEDGSFLLCGNVTKKVFTDETELLKAAELAIYE